jgi:cyclophilin family peptidyl-prolyl cis-trans isomerase
MEPEVTSKLFFLLLLISQLVGGAWAAEPVNPDLIPPEVVLPAPAPPTAAPGQTSTSNTAQQSPYRPNNNGVPQAAQPTNQPGVSEIPANASPPAAQPGNQPTVSTSANPESEKADPTAIIETDKGNIVLRLFASLAPKTVANFQDLVGKGFYNGLTFHRVEPGFCIQGGCPNGDGSGVYFEPGQQTMRFVNLEVSPSLRHNAAGVVAMAHFPKNPNSASCQFYITLSPQPSLDDKYSIFGGVIDGMDVINKIAKGDKINRISIQEQQ